MTQDTISFKMLIGRYYTNELSIVGLFLYVLIVLLVFFAPANLLLIIWPIAAYLFASQIIEFFRKYDTITFAPLLIEIGKESLVKVGYASIQKITLNYYGEKWDYVYPIGFKIGHENTIKIITKDGRKIVKNIRIENNVDYRRFKSLGCFLEEKGIEVKMKGFRK